MKVVRENDPVTHSAQTEQGATSPLGFMNIRVCAETWQDRKPKLGMGEIIFYLSLILLFNQL
jgi:hypothetical protein